MGDLTFYRGKNGQALSSRAVFLALMPVGASQVAEDWPNTNTLSGSLQNTARRLVGSRHARWSARQLRHGVMVTRTL